MLLDFLKALLVGAIAGIPIGPVLLMVVQRTLCLGRKQGMATGVGSAIGDMLYCALALLTFNFFLNDLIENHQTLMLFICGGLLAVIGIRISLTKVDLGAKEKRRESLADQTGYLLQTTLSVISNPGALAVLIGLLALFGLSSPEERNCPAYLVIIGVGLGEFLYWLLVVYCLARFVRIDEKTLNIISKFAGIAICIFAAVLVIRGIVSML